MAVVGIRRVESLEASPTRPTKASRRVVGQWRRSCGGEAQFVRIILRWHGLGGGH